MSIAEPPPPPEGFAPPCPKCQAPLRGLGENGDAGEGACERCATPLEYTVFPARRRGRRVARAARSVDGDATCYFHPVNHAAAICDGCGRYVCAVCEVPSEEGRVLCPPCVSSSRKKTVQKADEIVVYDQMAMTAALLPMFMWPITLLTAPLTLGLVIVGWRKPRSLLRPGRWRFVVAGLVALLQIGGWITFGVSLWLNF
jgi:hypothetical protein